MSEVTRSSSTYRRSVISLMALNFSMISSFFDGSNGSSRFLKNWFFRKAAFGTILSGM